MPVQYSGGMRFRVVVTHVQANPIHAETLSMENTPRLIIFLQSALPEEAIARVAQRVRQGGRDLLEDVICRRFTAGLERQVMNKEPIEHARDPDLRHSVAAMLRAAVRARELARQTGTRNVGRNGVVELLDPDAPELETPILQEPPAPYGERR
jgi:hypothetical protein